MAGNNVLLSCSVCPSNSKDEDITSKARTASLGMFLLTFLSMFVLAILFLVMLALNFTGTSLPVKSADSDKGSEGTGPTINSYYKYIYGLGLVLNFLVFALSITVIIMSIYMLVKIRQSSTYKTNPDDVTLKKVVAASIVIVVGGFV